MHCIKLSLFLLCGGLLGGVGREGLGFLCLTVTFAGQHGAGTKFCFGAVDWPACCEAGAGCQLLGREMQFGCV